MTPFRIKDFLILYLIIFLEFPVFSQNLEKISTLDHFNTISINQFKAHFSNNGDLLLDVINTTSGAFWPGGRIAYQPLVSFDHHMYGGFLDSVLTVNSGIFLLQPGRILEEGIADNPEDFKYRVYRIRKNWETTPFGPERDILERDYNEWPVEDGAPWEDVDGDGIYSRGIDKPKFVGDEVLFYVANDLDPARIQEGLNSLGVEFQVTIYAFNRSGPLGDAVFKRVKIINKNYSPIVDMYLGVITHYEIGNYLDNYSGYDSTLSLGYSYNITNNDDIYGVAPPAAGYLGLHGPIIESISSDSAYFDGKWINGFKNQEPSAFISYYDWQRTFDPRISAFPAPTGFPPEVPHKNQIYNNLSGKLWSGNSIYNPVTNQLTKYMLTGDPTTQTGWFMGNGWPDSDSLIAPSGTDPGISMQLLSFGPFNLAPSDTQEVEYAILAARGDDNLNSITVLKRNAKIIKQAYFLNFELVPSPPQPIVYSYPTDGEITLWWEQNAEDYEFSDPFIENQGFEDTSYTFEGYRIWQYENEEGLNPKLFDISDIRNDVSVIEDNIIANGISVRAPVIIAPNLGLRRYITITEDHIRGIPLYNGTPYYFGVSAYAFSKHSSPTFIESEPHSLIIYPAKDKIDYSSKYNSGDLIEVEQINGNSHSKVYFKIVDPTAITDDEYEVGFFTSQDTLKYYLLNLSSGDTLINKGDDFTSDTLYKEIYNGFMLLIDDIDRKVMDSLTIGQEDFGISTIQEIRGTNGLPLPVPVNVFNQLNSTGKWMIKSIGTSFQKIDAFDKIGRDDYEIKFLPEGSEYYYFADIASNTLFSDNQKAVNRVPFEIWNTTSNKRLFIKSMENIIKDSIWSQNISNGIWERIYGFDKSTPYVEPIPVTSGFSDETNYPIGNLIISGELPQPGTVIRIVTLKPLTAGDKFKMKLFKADFSNIETGRLNIDKITVFPNPYYAGNSLEGIGERIIRFAGLPTNVSVRIYSLAGDFVREIKKNDISQFLDWDLKNEYGELVASGMYIAFLEMPGIGEKIFKLAVIIGKEYINRSF